MRREPEHFGEQELSLIYIAKRLKEALQLEEVFTQSGIDYLVEPDRYSGGIIFRTQRIGAFFYVAPHIEADARKVMTEAGFKAFETGEG